MPRFLEISVSLDDVLPRPVRRFHLRATATFAALHEAIMAASGWAGDHLWAFSALRAGEEVPLAAPRGPGGADFDLFDRPAPDAARARLERGLLSFTSCRYRYDYGDGWEGVVLLHDLVELPDRRRRWLVQAEHPWPPQDCGGPPGYLALQEALATGEDPEGLVVWARETLGWTGEVDVEGIRRELDR